METDRTPARRDRSRFIDVIGIFLFCLAMHLPWLGLPPLAGTEAHRVFPARDMLQTGHIWVPMLYGKPFATKPPLHHWLIAAAERITGRGTVFVWRLPSALDGALLAGLCCVFGGRWFGRKAGIISGFCAAGMITLWGQWQVADLDATNSLAAAIAAFCGIELLVNCPVHTWPWVLASTIGVLATLMAKGPSGITIILGVWIWAAIQCVRDQRAQTNDGPSTPARVGSFLAGFVLPLVIGFAVFGLFLWVAKRSLDSMGFPPDLRGLKEASKRLNVSSRLILKSFLLIPTQLLLFSLPVSLAIPFVFNREVRRHWSTPERRVAFALAASVLIGLAICVINGMDNPRYAYVTLPPLCPLAGAVAVAAAREKRAGDWLRGAIAVSAIAMVAAAAVLSVGAWRLPQFRIVLITSVVLAVAIAVWVMFRVRWDWRSAWALPPLIFLTSVSFSLQRAEDRTKTSGFQTAKVIRDRVGYGATIAAAGEVTSKPETFYYANAKVNFFYDDFSPARVPAGTWVILDAIEHQRWLAVPGVRLEKDQWLCRNGKTDYYLAWYAGCR